MCIALKLCLTAWLVAFGGMFVFFPGWFQLFLLALIGGAAVIAFIDYLRLPVRAGGER